MRKTLAGLGLALVIALTSLGLAPAAQAVTYAPHLTVHSNQHDFNRKTVGAFVIQVTARHDGGARMAGRAWLYIGDNRIGGRQLVEGRVRFKISRGQLTDNKLVPVTVRIDPKNGDIKNRNTVRHVIDRKPDYGARIVKAARSQVGDGYRLGASGPSFWDCSGLVRYAVREGTGKLLPRTSKAQSTSSLGYRVSSPRAGDLVYVPGHIAVYAGNGRVIEAATPKTGVIERAMWQKGAKYIRIKR